MKEHNQVTVVKEYCLARRIPYKIGNNEQLLIGKGKNKQCIFCIYNIPWKELFSTIDRFVEYDEYGHFVQTK